MFFSRPGPQLPFHDNGDDDDDDWLKQGVKDRLPVPLVWSAAGPYGNWARDVCIQPPVADSWQNSSSVEPLVHTHTYSK